MTRPQKGGDDKRTITVRCRVTAAEKSTLVTLAHNAGLSPSDFMRGRMIGSAPLTHKANPDRAVLIKTLAELNKVGSNVNQIARALNRRYEDGEIIGVSKELIDYALHGVNALTAQLLTLLAYDHGHSR